MNVIFYAMDSLRVDHLSTFGYSRQTTPVLDRIAREGAAFSRCYAQSGWTAPCGASILSSQHPSATGIHRMRDALNPTLTWLPEMLGAAGWSTAGFSTVYQVSKLRGFDRGFDVFCDLFKDPAVIAACRERGQDSRGDDYCLPLSEDMHAAALRWLDERAARGAGRRPFFMLCWSTDTHEPMRHPPRHNIDADPGYRGPIDGRGRSFSRLRNRRDLRQLIDLYDGSIRYQDEQIGHFVAELKARGLLDDTLLVLFGDHGEMFYEHGIAGHGKYPHEELLRVPLILRGPGVPAGVRCDALVQAIDLAPTVLELAGLRKVAAHGGRSLQPLLEGAERLHDEIVIESPSPFHREEIARVVRADCWKYIEYTPPAPRARLKKAWKEFGRLFLLILRPGLVPVLHGHLAWQSLRGLFACLISRPFQFLAGRSSRRLFDLEADPREMHDLAARHPQVVARLREALDRGRHDAAATGELRSSPKQEAKIMDHLRRLGYVE